MAGAKNVLTALWTIDDRLTATFMSRFYGTWLSHLGMSPTEALQKTKLRYITSPSSAERDPATWAPFVLYEG
ncbi:CHAT domain-containing protein [Roseospira visakhapatnamensis]|uniref:CHAT domain-containing protein n=1 Tax=Roseospira visakhapatnamensis TaxID=390880 RepID=A0A7W6RHN4_9PROT|nr:CHAT domain-containing protein [Roseospira visakhapatnamensis]